MTNRDQNDDDSNEKKKEPPLCNFPGQNDTSCSLCSCPDYREDASDPEGRCINADPDFTWKKCLHFRKDHYMPDC
ncbi:hypothetical protein [Acinetobacter proteolyticus]|uniref:hypothetical protein n=1 Tax=Acinetobacter proteolyticus TaxID=1776741 RepID=UPI0012FEE1DC|nr:hypothetical protein [Acinetobacter proteolyticus]MBK5649096.1 hypothetical protein [Acinetobacter sp.]